MLLYRTKKMLWRSAFAVVITVTAVLMLIIGANSPGKFGSGLPILVERTLGDWVRDWSEDYYKEYFAPPAAAGKKDREVTTGYSVMEYLTLDPRRSERNRLEASFKSAVAHSALGKAERLRDVSRQVETQSLAGDKLAREIEPASSARFNLDSILSEVRYLESAHIFSFVKKGKNKKAKQKKKNKGPNYGTGVRSVYDFAGNLKISSKFFDRLRENTGVLIPHFDGKVYYSLPVKDFDGQKELGLMISVVRPRGFADLQSFYVPANSLSYVVLTAGEKDNGMVLAYKGPKVLRENGTFKGPTLPGVQPIVLKSGEEGVDHLVYDFYHPYGFRLVSFYPVRSIGYFVFRISLFIFLLAMARLGWWAIGKLRARMAAKPLSLPTGRAALHDRLEKSVENTNKSIELAGKTLEVLAESLQKPARVQVSGGFGPQFEKVLENLDSIAREQDQIKGRLDEDLDRLKMTYRELEGRAKTVDNGRPTTGPSVSGAGPIPATAETDDSETGGAEVDDAWPPEDNALEIEIVKEPEEIEAELRGAPVIAAVPDDGPIKEPDEIEAELRGISTDLPEPLVGENLGDPLGDVFAEPVFEIEDELGVPPFTGPDDDGQNDQIIDAKKPGKGGLEDQTHLPDVSFDLEEGDDLGGNASGGVDDPGGFDSPRPNYSEPSPDNDIPVPAPAVPDSFPGSGQNRAQPQSTGDDLDFDFELDLDLDESDLDDPVLVDEGRPANTSQSPVAVATRPQTHSAPSIPVKLTEPMQRSRVEQTIESMELVIPEDDEEGSIVYRPGMGGGSSLSDTVEEAIRPTPAGGPPKLYDSLVFHERREQGPGTKVSLEGHPGPPMLDEESPLTDDSDFEYAVFEENLDNGQIDYKGISSDTLRNRAVDVSGLDIDKDLKSAKTPVHSGKKG